MTADLITFGPDGAAANDGWSAGPEGGPLNRPLTADQSASLAMCQEQVSGFNAMISTMASVFISWGLPVEVILLALVKNMGALIRREEERARRKDLREQVIGRLNRELAVAELGRIAA